MKKYPNLFAVLTMEFGDDGAERFFERLADGLLTRSDLAGLIAPMDKYLHQHADKKDVINEEILEIVQTYPPFAQ